MALHRKQRGITHAAPQYVRIPASRSSTWAMNYSMQETRTSARRVHAKRYAEGDRSRKISSLQLRACFVLCVLLYFGAIYFADDIASIGRVVGSKQNGQNFFVHSLRPRGRKSVRVGRAVDANKVGEKKVPVRDEEGSGKDEIEQQQKNVVLRDVKPEVRKVEKTLSAAKNETDKTAKERVAEQHQKFQHETGVLEQGGERQTSAMPEVDARRKKQDADAIGQVGTKAPLEFVKDLPSAKPKTKIRGSVKVGSHKDEVTPRKEESVNTISPATEHLTQDQPLSPRAVLSNLSEIMSVEAMSRVGVTRVKEQQIHGSAHDEPVHLIGREESERDV
ncbi:unnamed protein product [Hyaloperonospora brassicae]|uniref:Transmembrane protein n=1 Tax=Hyaloperonospora brassicae TaxID=162125 RepID=A0AAV0UW99_HYABA|nr:unnamed protein product [Hyaloperonospora brassicae]